ncbi:MAG: RHS repeat-associated core domain-containing protein [Thermoguttaceae bacterium]|nr:RHS repeat-associated core domain-containing protein [Thermoguttaceae bacterium]
MMIQNNRFLPPSPLPHSLLPRGRRQGRYVPFSANHTNGTTYDFLGQLIAAGYSNTGLTDESYSYDSNGNRITANGSNYTTGSNNELTSDGSWTYTYDDEGNRVSKTNSTHRELYEWDYRNRLTKVTQQEYNSSTEEWQDVQIVEYTYDYNNIWIRKLLDTNGDGTPDSKSIFIPENYQTTVQIDDGIVTHHYLWTPNQQDKLLADTTTDGVLWSLTDHLGTIRDVLDGNSSTHLIYDAFGNLTSGTNPLLFGYTGKAFDPATNLQNNINRWYDATIGRWLSTDPIGFNGNDTNLYRYVNNSINKYLDTWGFLTCQQLKTNAFIFIKNHFLYKKIKSRKIVIECKSSCGNESWDAVAIPHEKIINNQKIVYKVTICIAKSRVCNFDQASFNGLLLHELYHAQRFFEGYTISEDTRKSEEEEAYRRQAEYLYPEAVNPEQNECQKKWRDWFVQSNAPLSYMTEEELKNYFKPAPPNCKPIRRWVGLSVNGDNFYYTGPPSSIGLWQVENY